jgi:hypothetical protein
MLNHMTYTANERDFSLDLHCYKYAALKLWNIQVCHFMHTTNWKGERKHLPSIWQKIVLWTKGTISSVISEELHKTIWTILCQRLYFLDLQVKAFDVWPNILKIINKCSPFQKITQAANTCLKHNYQEIQCCWTHGYQSRQQMKMAVFWDVVPRSLPDHTALQPRRQPSSYALLSEPQILLRQQMLWAWSIKIL